MKKRIIGAFVCVILIVLLGGLIYFYLLFNGERTEYFLGGEGEQWKTYHLKNGKKDGIEYVYYSDGSLMWEREYVEGKNIFSTGYYKSGKIMEILDRTDGKIEDIIEYYGDGTIKRAFLREGECIERYNNGNIVTKGYQKNYHREGLRTFYDINGNELSNCIYKDGERWQGNCPIFNNGGFGIPETGLQLKGIEEYNDGELIREEIYD